MSRSSYKLPFVHRSFWERSIKHRKYIRYHELLAKAVSPKSAKINAGFYFWKRGSSFSKRFGSVSRGIGLYNGKVFHLLYIKKSFSGYKLGQFNITRRMPIHATKKRQVKVIDKQKKESKKNLKKK